jgi:Zn-dependent protease with chaperone function
MIPRRSAGVWLVLSYLPTAVLAGLVAGVCAVFGELYWLVALLATYLVGDAYLRAGSRHHKLRYRGSPVTETTQPELRALIDDVMHRAGVRRLDGAWIEAGANAGALSGRRDWLERRRMGLTIGLLTVAHLDRADLQAVLAHEAGHLLDRKWIRARLVHRRQRAARVSWWTRVPPVAAYSRWFIRCTKAFALDAERDADATAVKMFGLEAAISALQRVAAIEAVHAVVADLFLRPGYLRGAAPPTLWEAYATIWQSHALVIDAVTQRLAAEDQADDTHPGLAERTHGQPFALAPTLRGNVAIVGFELLDERATFRLTRTEAKVALHTVGWSDFLDDEGEPQAAAPVPNLG